MCAKPAVMRRLMREITELQNSPPEGIRIQTSEDNMLDLTGIIQGPEGTPYANGYFKIKFHFTEEFPATPPKCRMVTKIFHPNVSTAGEICVNTLKKDWQPTFGIAHILVTVKCLLIYPNPESALDEEAGKLLLENYDDYCARARLITSVHARARPAEFAPTPAEGAASKTASGSSSKPPALPTLVPPFLAFTTATGASLPPLPPAPRAVSVSSAASNAPSAENDGVPTRRESGAGGVKTLGKERERHASPAPLGTADGNVASAKDAGAPPPVPSAAVAGKAVKRSATGAASGAEKKKKALKRL